ncbi:hypothetical protein FSZ31_03025 [Sphingorhabdus soli]|uniref:Uncharacterized protein n=1 Tax=Flavisphingopyxis soli TaxID=2601267 RepID=A0A5C6UMH0_9SPHN|nr:DUF6632 domain-containing protein [Sphingorhabdus soli]TXC73720.1 hypothetical protein FSZ31_03025 [Sphingorhabdus soli]
MIGRHSYLQAALVVFGVIFCLVYPLAIIWPSGWAWHDGAPAASQYFMMIVGVYATLGVFLVMAAKDPLGNASLIWFTVWSSVVHAVIMAAQALANPAHSGHLIGDVPALLFVAVMLGLLLRRAQARTASL